MGKSWKEGKGRWDKWDRNTGKNRNKKNKQFKPDKRKNPAGFDEDEPISAWLFVKLWNTYPHEQVIQAQHPQSSQKLGRTQPCHT